MSMIAQLAVAAAVYAIDRPYSYRVPEDMPLLAGMRVLVPFGHGNRRSMSLSVRPIRTMASRQANRSVQRKTYRL